MSTKNLTDAQLAEAGVGVTHHFGGGVYIKETLIPAGAKLTQHAHDHDHQSYLVGGQVLVQKGDDVFTLTGPAQLKIPAGVEHGVTALTNAIWLCIWAEDKINPEDTL